MAVAKYEPQLASVYMGLAADTKPAAALGDKFIESDTLKVFVYAQTGAWVQVGVYTTTTAPPVVI